jgi:hypothetical protein
MQGNNSANDLRQSIAEKLRGVRCPEHGSAPEVIAEGSNFGQLEVEDFRMLRQAPGRNTEGVERQLRGLYLRKRSSNSSRSIRRSSRLSDQ